MATFLPPVNQRSVPRSSCRGVAHRLPPISVTSSFNPFDSEDVGENQRDKVPLGPVLRTELEDQNWLDTLMALMKAAGNDTRVRILYLLWRRSEVRVNDLAAILQLTTPAISQQLKKLRGCNLVHARRDAQTIYYRLNTESEFIRSLVGFFEEEAD